jgi:hypothetical protein
MKDANVMFHPMPLVYPKGPFVYPKFSAQASNLFIT